MNMKANRVKPALSARFSEILLELSKKKKKERKIAPCLGNSEVYFLYWIGKQIQNFP